MLSLVRVNIFKFPWCRPNSKHFFWFGHVSDQFTKPKGHDGEYLYVVCESVILTLLLKDGDTATLLTTLQIVTGHVAHFRYVLSHIDMIFTNMRSDVAMVMQF